MNVSGANWKLNSVEKSKGFLIFNIVGYFYKSVNKGDFTINEVGHACEVEPAPSSDVPFVPFMYKDFCWKTSVSILEVEVIEDENILGFNVEGDFFPVLSWNMRPVKGIVIPDKRNIMRVSGFDSNESTYRNSGRTEYLRYIDLFKKYCKHINSGEVLDWGVGCARVAQHFIIDQKFTVTGIDIDAINIRWCNKNIVALKAFEVPLFPPTQLLDSEYELVISSSVLSHLVPDNWHLWLAELKRVSKDGAYAFISFHGDNSCQVMLADNSIGNECLNRDGWYDFNASEDLGREYEQYYRNTFFSDAYARSIMQNYFSVVEIVPGLLSGSQSVAVLRNDS